LKNVLYNLKLGAREYRLKQGLSIDIFELEVKPHDYSLRTIGHIYRELSSDTDKDCYYDYVPYLFYTDSDDIKAAYDVKAMKKAVMFLEKHTELQTFPN